jgi:hypothetical protein
MYATLVIVVLAPLYAPKAGVVSFVFRRGRGNIITINFIITRIEDVVGYHHHQQRRGLESKHSG